MADLLLGGQINPSSHERTEKTTVIGSGDLTTHGVIVGMTGSGKTGLGIVLIEEALRAGVPALLIDPKGDLTNLCLTFPDLAPTDFEPWVNAGDAAKAGQTVAEFAAAQATTWTEGLGGWGLSGADIGALRARVDFTIYTPGSGSGVGINIVGSLQAPADMSDVETIGDEIDGFVSGLLELVGIEADPLSSREHILLTNLIMNEWSNGRSLDLPTLVGMALTPPIRKLGVFELDAVLPAQRSHRVRDAAQRPARLAVVRGVDERPAARHRGHAAHPRRQATLRDRHHRPPRRRGAPVRDHADPVEARHVDAPPERHDRSAGAAVHGRGRRLPAAHGDAADEEADHDADEAGPGVRRRRRAEHAEPGRHRLQGDVERRHVDDRPAADRAGQAASARRHERRRRRRRRRRPSATRSAGWPSASSCCAAPARTSPRCSPRGGR